MIKSLICLLDGTEIFSGVNESVNIRRCTTTQCCNSGEELTLGSVCAACAEIVVQSPRDILRPEDVFTLYKVDAAGIRTKIGVFNVHTSKKKGDCLWQVTAYDNVVKLDIDLTEWLKENVAYLDDPRDFVDAVCSRCGVEFSYVGFNYDSDVHYIPYFEPSEAVTGRTLLQYVAQMLGYYCIATPDGEIRFDKYRDNTGVVLSKDGVRYRLQKSYKLKNEILPVDGVRVIYNRVNLCQTPANVRLENPYIVKDNPILDKKTMTEMFVIADYLMSKFTHDRSIFEFNGLGSLVACEVSIPASHDVNIGDIIVVDEQDPGELNTCKNCMRVMAKIQKGQSDTLKCTGSYRRPTQ